uniref:Histone-lysine N-methyltransferase n=1 Tax=Oryza punctata TaxID=4537 RepID=A0A0E0K107_ORYPU
MEEPDGEARGREDHAAVGRLGGEEGAVGGGGLALFAVPEMGGELGDGGKVCGGQERRLSTEEDGVRDNGGGSAAELVESVVNVSTPFEGRGQIGGDKESSLQKGSMNMAGEKHGSYPVESTEPSSLQTCHAPNGGVSNKTLFASCSEVLSSDNGHVRYLLDKATEGSICEHGHLACNKYDLGGATDVKTSTEDLQMVCTKPHCDSEGLSDSHHDSERWPQVVDGVGFMIKGNNELKQVDLIPKIEAEVSRSVEDDSIPSFYGGIDDFLGKAGCAHETLNDLGMSHMANGDMWSNVLYVPLSEGCQPKDARHVAVMVNKVTQGSQCGQGDLALLRGGVDVKKSQDDLQMCSKEPQCDNKGFPYLAEFGIQQSSYGMNVMCLKTDPNHELEKDELLTNTRGEFSSPIHEDSVPSISGSSIDNAGQIGETSEHRAIMEKVSHGSQGGGVLSCESRFLKKSHADENQSSTVEVKTCEEGLQTGQMKPCHSIVALSDSGKYGTDKLPRGGDGLRSMTGATHELVKDDFLPKSDLVVSCPVDEASVPSKYNSPIDVLLYKEDGLVGEISENRTGVDKLAHDLLGEVMLSCDSRSQTQASGDENQPFWMDVPKGSTASVCKVENTDSIRSCDPCAEIEFPLQQSREKHAISEFPPERDLTSSSHNLPCENEPCYSGRETPTFCLGLHDSADIGLESSDCSVQELNTCTSTDEKACSVDFVENGNDSHNQKEAPVIFFRRRNPVRAASSRNSNFEKCDQINKAGNSTRKSKKVDSVSSLLKSTMIKFPNKTTKGRSGINRPLNSSAWGSLQKLMDGFNQNCGPSTSRSHQTCLGKEISNRGSSEKKQLSIRKIRTSRCSKYKNTSFSDIGYLAGELNGQPTVSVRIDSNVSSDALFNSSDGAQKAAQCVEGNHTLKLTSTLTDTQQLERGLENVTQETCPGYIHGECGTSTSERSLNNANVGFSPDSVLDIASVTCESNTSATLDVIVHENPSGPGGLIGGGLRASALSTSRCENHHASSLMDSEQQAKTVRENDMRREDVIPSHAMMYNDIGEGKQTLAKSNSMRKGRNVGKQECQKKDGKKGKNINKNRSSTKISSSEASKLMSFSNDSPSLGPSELLLHTRPPKSGSCSKVLTSAIHDVGMHGYGNMRPFGIDNDDEGSAFDNVKTLRRKKKDSHGGKKGKVRDPHGKGRSKKINIADNTYGPAQLTDLSEPHMNKQSDLIPAAELAFKNSSAVSVELPAVVACKTDGASVPPPPAWVCCDDCEKWRCIPAELADKIAKDNLRWTCKENKDKTFGDCSIPQEKTNDEINAELGLSDASADEATGGGSNSKASGEPNFALLRSNLFLHRNRRTQSIDESMVCNCKPPQDGRMGCRDGCLNRILNIECTKRTCPCGEHCSNQQFQRRTYAKLGKFHTGKKGYGLQLNEDVSEGRFLIEYVGEVLDIMAYESRQRYYASKGQKHFYFMALNGGEVIDACTKGNLGRFINHSCSPNCRTEKWMVNGEVCIGIFAMRNIKKGEELTFDYNYVRVSGAAPQKCFCGTAKCRGYIGGDISGADMITQDDAEAGTFEPMAVQDDAEEVLGANDSSSHGTHLDIVDHEASTKTEDSNDCPSVNPELESEQQTSGTLFDIGEPENSLEALSPQDDEDVVRTPVHVSRTVESMSRQFPEYGTRSSEILQRAPCTLDGLKVPSTTNGIPPSSDLGNHRVPGFHANKKNNVKHHLIVNPSSAPIDSEHILGVEGRLNSLLDGNGGISKRKDATNGYLKLLLVTAAEGDNAGGTSKSVRDLSLILDALLKTKSNSVLLDIINKNGLQMLHNILKQNKSDFHRIPIIRKLVKVLEFLASNRILTSEHINGGPRCAGTESFRESMLGLLRHNDMQVQQIARNFRDRWIQFIPRNISRNEPTEYSRASISEHDIHGISTAGGSFPTSTCSMDWKSIRRKRKSRWDYQPDDHYKMGGLKIQKVCPVQSEFRTGSVGNKLHDNWGTSSSHNDVPVVGSSAEGADDEAPPGFESQQESRPGQACLQSGVSPGLYLESISEPQKLKEGSVEKTGKSHLVCLSSPFHHCRPIQEGVLVLPPRCLSMNTTVRDIVAGLQIETEECIGIGEMGREQNFHIIIKDGDFLTIIKDFEGCLLPPTSQEQGDPGP